eukprot:CAMPEP_0169181142 /NCGR_PEP_ID=MMETSP1015-20121227/68542_1 /TAXON_ID=342587 /ORGANISM="Karlodinium micrum, Strain CCMP2283" /LENGTH=71 /DNA_ID=CAMNT_0009256289 /DNA_START=464 /DNA_END=679 /DNA_ORIENTATION=+
MDRPLLEEGLHLNLAEPERVLPEGELPMYDVEKLRHTPEAEGVGGIQPDVLQNIVATLCVILQPLLLTENA